MSIILVSHTPTLASAILAKADNTTVSTKTLNKIQEVAARLYGVNNSGGLRQIASPLGKAAFKNDIDDCMKTIEAMPNTQARRDIGALLQRIETRNSKAYDKLAASFNRNDKQDLRRGIFNLENNVRLAYLTGSKGGTKST